MIIKRSFDYLLINRILTHPEIYKTIASDGAPDASEFKTKESNQIIYLVGFVDGEAIGVFIVAPENRYSYHVHVQVLPQHRASFASEFGRGVIRWVKENTDIIRLSASIPFLYPNVKEFATKMGFEIEGVARKAYFKHGEMHDQWHLGLILRG